MALEQLAIDGTSIIVTPDGLAKLTRRLMHEKPMTYKSHRLLMFEISKEWGLDWKSLTPSQRHVVEKLFDSSPDIERAARKVREEDAQLSKGLAHVVASDLVPEDTVVMVSEDPFAAVERETNERERQRKRWRR